MPNADATKTHPKRTPDTTHAKAPTTQAERRTVKPARTEAATAETTPYERYRAQHAAYLERQRRKKITKATG